MEIYKNTILTLTHTNYTDTLTENLHILYTTAAFKTTVNSEK